MLGATLTAAMGAWLARKRCQAPFFLLKQHPWPDFGALEMKDRFSYVEFIEQRYFGNVAESNFDEILGCFNDDAQVIILHGDKPERRFALYPQAAESDLLSFYQHLCDNYECWFGNYHHYIDLETDSAASRFTVRLTPNPTGIYASFPAQELRNCNFFEFRDGRISDMIIYYANPETQTTNKQPTGKPTGYPSP